MSYHFDNIVKLPLVEEKLLSMPAHQRSYLEVAFDEAITSPTLCADYASEWGVIGNYVVELVAIRVAYACFRLALAANKPPVMVDIEVEAGVRGVPSVVV